MQNGVVKRILLLMMDPCKLFHCETHKRKNHDSSQTFLPAPPPPPPSAQTPMSALCGKRMHNLFVQLDDHKRHIEVRYNSRTTIQDVLDQLEQAGHGHVSFKSPLSDVLSSRCLVSFHFEEGIVIHAQSDTIHLTIRRLEGPSISFDVPQSLTILAIREKLVQSGFPFDEQRLIFRGRIIEDDHLLTLAHFKLPSEGSNISMHLVRKRSLPFRPSEPRFDSKAQSVDHVSIFVTDLEGKKQPMNVSPSGKILDLMESIQTCWNIPVQKQRLFWEGKLLQPNMRTDKITRGSLIHLMTRGGQQQHQDGKIGSSIVVNFHFLTGKVVSFSVNKTDLVEDLKFQIQGVEGIPMDQQRLIFGGAQMCEERSLDSYGIEDGNDIYVILRLRGNGHSDHPEVIGITPEDMLFPGNMTIEVQFESKNQYRRKIGVQVDREHLFVVLCEGKRVVGETLFDMSQCRASFHFREYVPPGKVVKFCVNQNAIQNENGCPQINIPVRFFKVCANDPISLCVIDESSSRSSNPREKTIVIERNGPDCLAELFQSICTAFQCSSHAISSISLSHGPMLLSSVDVYHLQPYDSLFVSFLHPSSNPLTEDKKEEVHLLVQSRYVFSEPHDHWKQFTIAISSQSLDTFKRDVMKVLDINDNILPFVTTHIFDPDFGEFVVLDDVRSLMGSPNRPIKIRLVIAKLAEDKA